MFLSGSPRARVRLRGNTWRALFALLLAALFGASPARAQIGVDDTGTGGRHVIQGRIVFPSGRRADSRLKVRRSEEHTSELQYANISYAVFCLKKNKIYILTYPSLIVTSPPTHS